MKRAVVVRSKHIVSSAVLAFGIMCPALSSYAQEPQFIEYRPDYPRLGLIAIGGDQTYPAAAWSTYAKFNYVVMGGGWEGWGDNRGWTREDVVTGIKAASTIGTKVFQYVNFESNDPRTGYAWNPSWIATANANNWWLYQAGTSGTVVKSPNNSNYWIVNQTHWSPLDPATGYTPYQSAANYSYDLFIAGTSTHPRNAAPSLDGIYLDNVWYAPDADGDWNRDGVTDSQSDPDIQNAYRAGNADFAKEIHRLGKMAVSNNGNWPLASTEADPATDPWAIGPLYKKYNGGVLEALIGASWSYETWAGFTVAMSHYQALMEMLAEPKLEILNQESLKTDGSDNYDATPYHAMRYGLCWTLMNDAYYAGEVYSGHLATYNLIPWFDEYDAGGIGQGYLGQPARDWRGAIQTKARWNYGPLGVWAREFEGGIAIMNPKGNGPVTLTIEDVGGERWKHFYGSEDPKTNNGQDVTGSITLADRDGVVLLRRHPLGDGK